MLHAPNQLDELTWALAQQLLKKTHLFSFQNFEKTNYKTKKTPNTHKIQGKDLIKLVIIIIKTIYVTERMQQTCRLPMIH